MRRLNSTEVDADGFNPSLRLLLIGAVFPPVVYDRLRETSPLDGAQTQMFNQQLATALSFGGAELTLLSAVPAVSYPHDRTLAYGYRRFQVDGMEGRSVPFVNLPVVKHVTKFAGTLCLTYSALRREKHDCLVTVGLHSPFMAAALISGRLLRCPLVAVLTDPPNVPHKYESNAVRRLKALDARWLISMLRRYSALVVLAPALAQDFAPELPYVVMEGIAAPNDMSRDRSESSRVVYAGRLSDDYGVRNLIDAHAMSPTFDLHLYGSGPMEDELRARSRMQARLWFHGVVPRDEVLKAYSSAKLLVNPRPPDTYIARYSFPSKLIEYMASGVPTLTTKLPALPEDFVPHVFFCDADPTSISMEIQRILNMPGEEAFAFGAKARSFVQERASARTQGQRLLDLIARIQ